MLLYRLNTDQNVNSQRRKKCPIWRTTWTTFCKSDFSLQLTLIFGSSEKHIIIYKSFRFSRSSWNIKSAKCFEWNFHLQYLWNIFFLSNWSDRLCSCHCRCNCCWNFSWETNCRCPSSNAIEKFGLLVKPKKAFSYHFIYLSRIFDFSFTKTSMTMKKNSYLHLSSEFVIVFALRGLFYKQIKVSKQIFHIYLW